MREYIFSTRLEYSVHREEIRRQLRQWAGDGADRLFVALNEAVNNALHHGTNERVDRCVVVRLDKYQDTILLQVRHDGAGYGGIPPRVFSEDSNLWEDHGRGLAIINEFSDQVDYDASGQRITIVKRLLS